MRQPIPAAGPLFCAGLPARPPHPDPRREGGGLPRSRHPLPLLLIEAKFTSPNTTYGRGPRQDARSLTLDELLEIYRDPSLQILDYAKAKAADQVHYQLWRNMTFAEWMARGDHPETKAYHVNLVREGFEEASAAEFAGLVNPAFQDRFRRLTWEGIYRSFLGNPALETMCRYLETKTAGLVRAFHLETPAGLPGR
jgi:hypothetical protein